jgi:hypothetical protein
VPHDEHMFDQTDPLEEPVFRDVQGFFGWLANLSMPEEAKCRAEESNLATPQGPDLQSGTRPSAHGEPTSG